MTHPDSSEHAASDLLDFINRAPTPYHAAANVADRFRSSGFAEWMHGQRWEPAGSGRGFARIGDGAVLAVDLRGGDLRDGVTILAAHTDSPALRVKERGVSWRKGYLALPTEAYGGPIRSTWTDRELGLSGRVVTTDGRVMLFSLPETAIIPNLAIHLNRTVNEGFEYNPQTHLVALTAARPNAKDENAADVLSTAISEAVGISADEVFEFEVLLHDALPGGTVGSDGSMFSASRIDNLAGCYTNLEAFLTAEGDRPRMLMLYNHEEVGSQTGEGAQAGTIEGVVRRLIYAGGGDAEDLEVALQRSSVVSNDAAHALHPSYADKYDPDYAPVLGGGPVLKMNAMYRYATTAASAAAFRRACVRADVPMQRQANRSDMRSGSTVGPMTWARTGIQTVDVGLPLLAMHSIRESAGTADVGRMIAALKAYLTEN